VLEHSKLAEACNEIVARARVHFREADRIMAAAPRRVVRAPRIMSAAYQLILDELVARGWSAPRAPIRLSRARLLFIVLRYALI
jgi:phytoene/squalene synthetase